MNQLTDMQRQRYRRQLILQEVGEEGQKKLLNAKVLIIGAGGLGSPIALYLAAAGIGKIGIVDYDIIDISNLQRQILHATKSIGKKKILSAKKRLKEINPEVQIETYKTKIAPNTNYDFIADYDIVISAVDNLETRYTLNDLCIFHNIPLIEGAINNFEGHVTTIIPKISACYRCLFHHDPKQKRKEIGVMGTIPGIIGTLQATEAIKYLLQKGTLLQNRLLYYNALTATFREIKITRDSKCPSCSTMN
jgi:adenylyltransferase/sulfurtransferase